MNTASSYLATGGISRTGPAGLVITLIESGPSSGSAVVLNVTPMNGLFAKVGSGAWAGVSGLVLPYG